MIQSVMPSLLTTTLEALVNVFGAYGLSSIHAVLEIAKPLSPKLHRRQELFTIKIIQ